MIKRSDLNGVLEIDISRKYIDDLFPQLLNHDSDTYKAFGIFIDKLYNDLGISITENKAIEILVIYLMVKPILETFFVNHMFVTDNALKRLIEKTLKKMIPNLRIEKDKLKSFQDDIESEIHDAKAQGDKLELHIKFY